MQITSYQISEYFTYVIFTIATPHLQQPRFENLTPLARSDLDNSGYIHTKSGREGSFMPVGDRYVGNGFMVILVS